MKNGVLGKFVLVPSKKKKNLLNRSRNRSGTVACYALAYNTILSKIGQLYASYISVTFKSTEHVITRHV